MYELENLSALACFIKDHLEPGEEYMCTLNGDFLSPSLLSSLDLGRVVQVDPGLWAGAGRGLAGGVGMGPRAGPEARSAA